MALVALFVRCISSEVAGFEVRKLIIELMDHISYSCQ
jgi:hypothetical protein